VYSLDSGAPSGAVIDAKTGVFSWIPSTSQALGDYTVTVRVALAGAPELSDSETITVTLDATGPVSSGLPNVPMAVGDSPPAVNLFLAFEARVAADSALAFSVTAISNTALLGSNLAVGSLSVNSSGNFWLYRAANQTGSTEITIRATNTAGQSTDATFRFE